MRTRQEIAESLGGGTIELRYGSAEVERQALMYQSTQVELLLDLRDQNEKILQNLKNIDEHLTGIAQRLW